MQSFSVPWSSGLYLIEYLKGYGFILPFVESSAEVGGHEECLEHTIHVAGGSDVLESEIGSWDSVCSFKVHYKINLSIL